MELLCRICAARSDSLVDIFTERQMVGNKNVDLAHIINNCSTHPIKCGDALPQRICPVCLESAGNAFRFREMCEKSYEYLCKMLKHEDMMDDHCDMYIKKEHSSYTDDKDEEEKEQAQEQEQEERQEYEIYIKEETDIDNIVEPEDNMNRQYTQSELQNYMEHNSDGEEDANDDDREDLLKVNDNDGDWMMLVGVVDNSTRSKREHRIECPHCSKPIRRHLMNYHINTHTGEKPFKCTDCSRAFSDPYNLRRHSLIHQEPSFKCPHCPKKFTHSWILNVHIRIHTGDRPFKCSYCSKRFAQSSTLDQHLRTHSVIRPFQCTYCPKNFKKVSNLNAHIRTHTGARPYKCSYCPKDYAHSSTLNRHVRTHNGEPGYMYE